MSIYEVTRDAVLKAIQDFEVRGRDSFLKRYGFGRSRGYYLSVGNKLYDSKAIVGAAHGFVSENSVPLGATDFSGGENTVARVLENLGFQMIRPNDRLRAGQPFDLGATYHRQTDIHQVFGGQEQGGISMPREVPFVFLFTGIAGPNTVTTMAGNRTERMPTPARVNWKICSSFGATRPSAITMQMGATC